MIQWFYHCLNLHFIQASSIYSSGKLLLRGFVLNYIMSRRQRMLSYRRIYRIGQCKFKHHICFGLLENRLRRWRRLISLFFIFSRLRSYSCWYWRLKSGNKKSSLYLAASWISQIGKINPCSSKSWLLYLRNCSCSLSFCWLLSCGCWLLFHGRQFIKL